MRMKKFPGLSNKQVSVSAFSVLFLEESDIDGKPVCNIHFNNGRWVTTSLSLNQVQAVLDSEDKQDEEAQMASWKKTAEIRRKAKIEADEALRHYSMVGRIKSSSKTEQEDGTFKLEFVVDPDLEPRKDS